MEAEITADGLITYLGTIIGGLLTLGGVAITIQYEKQERRSEQVILYKPILEVYDKNLYMPSIKRQFIVTSSMPSISTGDDNENEKIMRSEVIDTIFFKNVGRGEAKNTKLLVGEIKDYSWDNGNDLMIGIQNDQYIGEVTKDGILSVDIVLPSYLTVPSDMREDKKMSFRFIMGLEYSDMFEHKTYEYSLTIPYEISIINIENNWRSFEESKLVIAKVGYSIGNPLIDKKERINI